MRIWLALAGILPLLAVGSGATAGTSNSPPQNGLIAVQGVGGIYIVDPRTETARLVPKSEELSDPAWSPDGTTLAVTSSRAGSYDVYTMKPDGNERRLVLRNALHPSWSPDGKQFVVVRRACGSTDSTSPCSSDEQGGTSLAIVNADGTDVRALGSKESRDALAPEWSPDGKLIAFVDYAGSIKLVAPDGESVPMTAAPTTSASVSWSPDSSKLAYDRYDEKSAGSVVVVLDRASDRETVLRGQQSGAEAPVWSPEGDQLVFNSMEVDSSTASGSCRDHFPSRLWMMAQDGTKAHQVGTGYLAYGTASWARAVDSAPVLPPIRASTETAPPNPTVTPAAPPTATATPPATPQPTATVTPKRASPPAAPNGPIAVRGEGGIYLVDPDSAKASKVPGTAEMSAPEWSPGMRLLAVEKTEKGGATSIYTIWPNGSHPQLVLRNASLPSWSADGDRIFAVRSECTTACADDDDANVLYAVNLDGSDVQRVDFEDADVYNSRELAWPTDGSAIHFFDEQSLTGPGSFDSSAAIWSPDGAQLVFAGSVGPSDEPGTRKTGLWIVSADGGRPHLLLSGASGRPSWVSS